MLSRNDLSWILSPQKGLAVENDPLFFGRKPKGKIGNRPEWNGANLTACRHKTGENKAPFGVCGYVGLWVCGCVSCSATLSTSRLRRKVGRSRPGEPPSNSLRRFPGKSLRSVPLPLCDRASSAVECGLRDGFAPPQGGHLRIYPHTHRYPHWERGTLFHGAGAEPRVPRVRSPAYPSMAFSM